MFWSQYCWTEGIFRNVPFEPNIATPKIITFTPNWLVLLYFTPLLLTLKIRKNYQGLFIYLSETASKLNAFINFNFRGRTSPTQTTTSHSIYFSNKINKIFMNSVKPVLWFKFFILLSNVLSFSNSQLPAVLIINHMKWM